jgi:hypothetical protein
MKIYSMHYLILDSLNIFIPAILQKQLDTNLERSNTFIGEENAL